MRRKTSCEIILSLEDIKAKAEANMNTSSNAVFADINVLKKEEIKIPDYATLELNQFILDGMKEALPDKLSESGYAFFSSSLSGEEEKREEITLDINFENKHKSLGLTFQFVHDYPKEIEVTWYYNDLSLNHMIFYPDNVDYFCEKKVDGYNRISLVFRGSQVPYRYLRLDNILFGSILIMQGDKIKQATLLEEVNPTSSELSVNNLEFTLFDESNDFNVLNPKGRYELLTRGQRVIVKESINDTVLNMGTFYLDSWEGSIDKFINFKAIDAVGILDNTNFYQGRIYKDEQAGVIIDEIMQSAGWTKYEIQSDVYQTLLSGYISVCTHRQALQQVAFALRAIVSCNRSDRIRIYRPESTPDSKLKYDRKFQNGTVGVKDYVSSVAVTMHEYQLNTEEKQLFKGNLSSGISLITFQEPSKVISITGGVFKQHGTNYAYVSVENNNTEVIILGNVYLDEVSTLSIDNTASKSGAVNKVISVKEATLVTQYNVYLVASHLMNFYSLDREAKQRFICESEQAGKWVAMKSQNNRFVTGSITKMKLDLTGGFLAEAEITGYNSLEKDPVFTGKEIFTGEEIGVL